MHQYKYHRTGSNDKMRTHLRAKKDREIVLTVATGEDGSWIARNAGIGVHARAWDNHRLQDAIQKEFDRVFEKAKSDGTLEDLLKEWELEVVTTVEGEGWEVPYRTIRHKR